MIQRLKCPYEGQRSADLKQHMKTHTGEKNCKDSENNQCTLKSHKFKPTGERFYKCNIYSNEFAQASGLLIHQRKHTGETPFKCTVCPKKCTQSARLTEHHKKHISKTFLLQRLFSPPSVKRSCIGRFLW